MRILLSEEELQLRGIYAIRNTVSCKVYIGQTIKTFKKRLLEHLHDLNATNRTDSRHLQNAYSKYGGNVFEAVIQEVVPSTIPDNEIAVWLNSREIFWIAYYRRVLGEKNVYNLNDGAGGYNPSQETRELLSQRLHKRYESQPELRQRISEHHKKLWEDEEFRTRRMEQISEQNQRTEIRQKNAESQKKRWI